MTHTVNKILRLFRSRQNEHASNRLWTKRVVQDSENEFFLQKLIKKKNFKIFVNLLKTKLFILFCCLSTCVCALYPFPINDVLIFCEKVFRPGYRKIIIVQAS